MLNLDENKARLPLEVLKMVAIEQLVSGSIDATEGETLRVMKCCEKEKLADEERREMDWNETLLIAVI